MKKYYAIMWPIGQSRSAETGKRFCAVYYSFPSKTLRDEWCNGGGDFPTSRKWREPVLANDSELRQAVKNEQIVTL